MNNQTSSRRPKAYPFQLSDPVSGRTVRARFLANVTEIADCLAAWEIVAPVRQESATS